jgi:enterochelin esterase-like enzyme
MAMHDARYVQRKIVRETVKSAALGETRNLRIYLPPGYNELYSYPAIYCQDGEQFFNFGRIATHATRLILDEGMEPCIIVGVDVRLEARTAEYAPEGDRFSAYCRFFAEEMVPFVDGRFPTRRSADERIAAGDSLGGTVSLHIAMEYPHLFQNVLSLSGAFLAATQERIREETELSQLKMFMLVGRQETAVKTERGIFDFLRANREVHTLLNEKLAKVRYVEKDGEHIWGFWQNELPAALCWFLR